MTPELSTTALIIATLFFAWWSHHEYVVKESPVGGSLWSGASIFLAGLAGYSVECLLCSPAQ